MCAPTASPFPISAPPLFPLA
uniref:Uncharacterized protein n=1 Tax=Arundo donax TaxID=35708 RepID=A0A0A9GUH9_ARUDO